MRNKLVPSYITLFSECVIERYARWYCVIHTVAAICELTGELPVVAAPTYGPTHAAEEEENHSYDDQENADCL